MSTAALLLLVASFADAFYAGAADQKGLLVKGAGPGIGKDGRTLAAIGLETLGGTFTPLLPKGCPVPCSTTETFTTAADEQTQITVTLYRGDAARVAQAEWIGRFEIHDCVSGRRGTPKVALTVTTTGSDLVLAGEDLRSKTVCRIVSAGRG